MKYDAFISYSHAADGRLAPALQRALQKMAKRWYRRRALEVFRDETGLSVDPHLWGAIVRALDDSEWFLLLTSPGAAQSEWVNKEIEHWKAHRNVDRMLPVLTDGHWEWDSAAGDFTPDSDAVPPALRGYFTDEPRHLDLRFARTEQQLDLRNSRFRNAVAEIAAPLHGVSKDEIEGEDVRQHRRTVRVASSAAVGLAVLTVAAVVAAFFAVGNAHRAEERRIQADAQRLAAQSQSELERPDLAFLLAANAYRTAQNAATEGALLTSVANRPEFKQRLPSEADVTAVAISDAAERVWVGGLDGNVVAYRYSDGQKIGRIARPYSREVVALSPSRAGSDAVVVTDGTVVDTLGVAMTTTVSREAPHAVLSMAVDQSTGFIAGGSVDGNVMVWAPDGARPVATFVGIPADAVSDYRWITAVAWTPDGRLVVAGQDGAIRLFAVDRPDAPLWVQQDVLSAGKWVTALAVTADGTVAIGCTDGTVAFLSGADGTPAAEIGRVHIGAVQGLAVTGSSAGGGSIASVADDGAVVYWNHLTGQPLSGDLGPARFDEREGTAVGWDPANQLRGVTGGAAGGALLLGFGDEERRPLARPVEGWEGATTVALSPSGDRLAVVRTELSDSVASELVITDPRRPDPAARSVRVSGLVEQLVFTPDGTRVLASTSEGDVAVWDGQADAATVTEVAPGQDALQVAVAPDGQTVATTALDSRSAYGASSPIRLWRLDGDRLVAAGGFDGPVFARGLAFTPDGSRLVVGGSHTMAIHPMGGGEATLVDLGDDVTRSVAVDPTGKTVAVGLGSGPVRIIDVETGTQAGDDLRVSDEVTDMAFRGDGAELVTVSQDGSLILWDMASRQRLSDRNIDAVDLASTATAYAEPTIGVGPDFAVTASFGEKRLVSWSLDPEDWIAEGCAVHRRDLTDAEREQYGLLGAAPVCSR